MGSLFCFGGKRGDGEGDAEEGCGWFGGCVFDGDFPKQPDLGCWRRTGRPIAPSMAQ